MRELLSKSIAGGLSAAVVLLWWPVLFDGVDTVTSWLARGVAWTVCFESLLLALVPFERALWETSRGERLAGRVDAAQSRLHSGSHRKRISRLSAVATMAMAVPIALLVTGLHEQPDARAEGPVLKPIKVVRVTKVVKVQKVVPAGQARAPVQRPVEVPAP
jgi:hypothetical protein